MALSVPDAKDLEKPPGGSESNDSLQFRDFFWDTIILYVVSVIVGLTAVDVVSEYIRGSDVKCYHPEKENIDNVQDYVNSVCSGSLPSLEYFPAFLVIHGVLLQIPHYLWLNLYGSSFAFFFGKVQDMDFSDGTLSSENLSVLRQLENSFSTYKQNSMFLLYRIKLWLQAFLAIAGLGIAAGYFCESSYVFLCPAENSTLDPGTWPLDRQAVCVFTSLRLISTIRVGYLFLVALVVASLAVAILWTSASHPKELGAELVARFIFETALQPHHYVPRLTGLPGFLSRRLMKSALFASVPWIFGRKIETDLDFMVVMLFRTHSGLGQRFKELQTLALVKQFDDQESTIVTLHRGDQGRSKDYLENYGAFADKDLVSAETRWQFSKNKGDELSTERCNGVLNTLRLKELCPPKHLLIIPNTIRGAILGFAVRAPTNGGALCVNFGSHSMGVGYLLARVFQRVGIINFTADFRSGKDAAEFAEVTPHVGSGIVSVVCRDDVMSVNKYKVKFLKAVNIIWFTTDDEDAEPVETSFILVGPITHPHQSTTVNVLLELAERFMNECTILVMQPTQIGGKPVDTDFPVYTPKPCNLFKPLVQDIVLDTTPTNVMEWPVTASSTPSPIDPPPNPQPGVYAFNLPVLCGGLPTLFRFSSYKYSSQDEGEEEKDGGKDGEEEGGRGGEGGGGGREGERERSSDMGSGVALVMEQ